MPGIALHARHHGADRRQLDLVIAAVQKVIRLAEGGTTMTASGRPGAHDLIGLRIRLRPPPLRPTLPSRGPVRLDASDRFAFCPFEGGRLELSGVFGGSFSLCSKAVRRAVNDTTCSQRATMRASFWACDSVVRSAAAEQPFEG